MKQVIGIATVFCLALTACSDSQMQVGDRATITGQVSSRNAVQKTQVVNQKKGSIEKSYEDISYSADLISAFEFIERRGEKPAEADRKDLENESVVIFEMSCNEGVSSIFESKKIKMSQEDATAYLMDNVGKDFTVVQGEKEHTPHTVLYDGHLTGANKIRVFLFFNELEKNEKSQFKYYDRLFGAGFMNL